MKKEKLKASIEVDDGTLDNWTQLLVKDKDDRDLFLIEKNEVIEGELGQEEIEEFKEEIVECKPTSAVKWLLGYFDKVKVIYAFQILNSVDNDESWNIVGVLKSKIWSETEGILQADNEGFSNEQGYHILWQFSDNASGPWYMAVKDSSDNFVNFKMDLGDKKQRQEFFDGRVPKGAELV
ncbi:MAG: hypothetical protein KF803_18900 [Cyclobacteriaceae bacterium]|nr:hypothetical protein [Cyclobacteriaceae bacterium]